jgi:transcriptional regulator with XRE-family HTH domain
MNLVAFSRPFEAKLEENEKDPNFPTELGPLLSKLAKKKRIKQTDLAKKSNISRISVNRFFRGKSEIRASDLVSVLKHLGIDLEERILSEIRL